jgi:peptidoglycan hydrolase-like protein with peptidoglycan-binding domain
MFKSLRLCSMPALLKVTSGAPIARGANGPQVAFLQDLLSDLGHPMPKSWKSGRWDGIFGGETDASVRQFQQGKGLKPDGMVGPLTLKMFDLAILANPMLELIDLASYKAVQMQDRILPPQRRGCTVW